MGETKGEEREIFRICVILKKHPKQRRKLKRLHSPPINNNCEASTQTCKERRDKSGQTTTKVKKVATQTMDSPIITKDAATQSSLGLTDVLTQCDLDNRVEISWKFQLMQQQNQKLQQGESKLLSQKNSIAAATT
uniref:Uncharacterized protein n=1 Tax=Meloidogyne incognita TaxID=6306 RepID=A0A914N8T4_MELIC